MNKDDKKKELESLKETLAKSKGLIVSGFTSASQTVARGAAIVNDACATNVSAIC